MSLSTADCMCITDNTQHEISLHCIIGESTRLQNGSARGLLASRSDDFVVGGKRYYKSKSKLQSKQQSYEQPPSKYVSS